MGKNNRNKRKARQAMRKIALSGMKEMRNRWAKEALNNEKRPKRK